MFWRDERRIEMLEECCREARERADKMSKVDGDLVSELKLVRLHLQKHQERFENHDDKEMEKYDEIRESLSKMNDEIVKFNKIFWVVIGAIGVLNFLGVTDSLKALIRHSVEQNYKISDVHRGHLEVR
ncbi:hypothetical protein [Nitratifractor sp.]|uniref:hypothetical protein n=1 Tax=Nitratifractor sp. TaxID=2268144 RepID=UPI0025CE0BA5|nr:hypothetical protein [Nitratifractor sp.]